MNTQDLHDPLRKFMHRVRCVVIRVLRALRGWGCQEEALPVLGVVTSHLVPAAGVLMVHKDTRNSRISNNSSSIIRL